METLEAYFEGNHAPAPRCHRLAAAVRREGAHAHTVQHIPYDQPNSYNRLASELDAYGIGHLMGANPVPLLVPCHRVSRGSDRPEVYVGGLVNLHTLQALEAG